MAAPEGFSDKVAFAVNSRGTASGVAKTANGPAARMVMKADWRGWACSPERLRAWSSPVKMKSLANVGGTSHGYF